MKLAPPHRLALSRWLLIFILPSLSIISLTAESHAQEDAPSSTDIKRAADSYDLGRERFRDGDFTEAAERFEAADSYAPSAAALRLAIASRKEAGQMARAATLAALALERYPDETDLRSEAETILADAGPQLAKLSVSCDVQCELTLNNRLVHGSGAQSRTLYVDPGKITLRATWSEGRTQSERIKLEVGDSKGVSFYAPALPDAAVDGPTETEPTQSEEPTEEAGEKSSKGWSPAVFWTGAALTAGGIGASVALGVRALNHPGKDAVLANCEANDRNCPEYVEGRQNQMVANIAVGATAAVGVFTLITGIWLTDWGGKKMGDQALAGHSKTKGQGRWVRPLIAVGDGAFVGAQGAF